MLFQLDEQTDARMYQEDRQERRWVRAHAEHRAFPRSRQKIWRPCQRGVPNRGPLGAEEHPPGHPLYPRPGAGRKYYLQLSLVF